MKKSGAPRSIALIRDEGADVGEAPAFIRQIGSLRRVFLLKHHMTAHEMEGLAYRIETLTKNDALSSILIATDTHDNQENGALPSFVMDRDRLDMEDEVVDDGLPPAPGQTFYVSAGYDALDLYQSGKYKNREYLDKLFRSLAALGDAVAGDARKTKIPTITVPHGILTDGGYVWLRASYVMATRESSFRILNPSRGLSLDPVGLSYHLTRVGKEFLQTSQNYIRGCAFLMGLAGFEANNSDMILTGMATQLMESPAGLGLLECTLAEIVPWQAQALITNPQQWYGRSNTTIHDGNAVFRNVQVGDIVRCFADAHADSRDFMHYDNNDFDFEDPSLTLDPVPWQAPIQSELVEIAMAIDYILRQAPDLRGRVRLIDELARETTNNVQDQVMINMARELSERLHEQSPLAVMVVHRLLELAADPYCKLDDCVVRERRVQMAMMEQPDFALWGQHNVDGVYKGPWHHKSLYDVTDDQVEAIVESQKEVAAKKNVSSLMFHSGNDY